MTGHSVRTTAGASTVDLDDLAARLHRLAAECRDRATSLEDAARLLPGQWHPRANAIAIQVADISRAVHRVGAGVDSTSEAYSQRENSLRALAHEASSAAFWGVGRVLALLAPAVIPAALGAITALLAASALTGKRPEELIGGLASAATRYLPEAAAMNTTDVISSPAFVDGVELAVSGLDDFAAGLLGMPLPLIATIGEGGLGLSHPSAVAGLIVGVVGTIGGTQAAKTILTETPVAVTRVSVETVIGPQGLEQLIGRIPRADPEMPQVRIERYQGTGGGHPSFVVYLGGTIDAALMATDEPWDMTSNVTALAGMDAGSYRAAVEAMHAAGITSDTPVTLVGHSQGGLLAARIAESEEFWVGDVVTVGAPLHQVRIPAGVTLTAIEHNEDLVPTLGGIALAGVGASALGRVGALAASGLGSLGTTTTVRRSALAGITPNTGDSLPGHNLTRYIETGRVMDNSTQAQLIALRERLAQVTKGVSVATAWRGDRVGR